MKWKSVRIKNQAGEILFEGPFNELPIKEDYIVQKSIELYQECEPCIIYRTHITKKLYLEILDTISVKPKKGAVVNCGDYPQLFAPFSLDMEETQMEFL